MKVYLHYFGVVYFLGLTIFSSVRCDIDDMSRINSLSRLQTCNGDVCRDARPLFLSKWTSKLIDGIYGPWTRWQPCNSDCQTRRSRYCRVTSICGNTVMYQDSFCYRRGSHCHIIYEKSKRRYFKPDLLPATNGISKAFSGSSNLLESFDRGTSRWGALINSSEPYNSLESRNTAANIPIWRSTAPSSRNFLSTSPSSSQQLPQSPVTSTSAQSGKIKSLDDELLSCGVARSNDLSIGLALRILGGRESLRGRWPWQVAVLNKNKDVFCGGTLISSRWVLTAAHCVRKYLRVTIGEHHLHRPDGTEQNYEIDAMFIHPRYDPKTVANDIALLHLPQPAPIGNGIACIPDQGDILPRPGTTCTILGWGQKNPKDIFGTTELHEAKVPIVSLGQCKYAYGFDGTIKESMFCAGHYNGSVDSCKGDSGGPLLCSRNNKWFAVGITSFGEGCGKKNKYGIYTNVSKYAEWIKKIMVAMSNVP